MKKATTTMEKGKELKRLRPLNSHQTASSYLPRAIADGHAKLIGKGKQQRVLYVAINFSERFADPEEQVRAEFWAELIYRLGYEPHRIGVEVTIPDRTPKDAADLVVFHDQERKRPYAVI